MNLLRIHPLDRSGRQRLLPFRISPLLGASLALALLATGVLTSARAVQPATSKHRPTWLQLGRATWYGKQFHGRRTASGEKFDMHAFTAAHRSLPLGSWIRVTNTANLKSVLVRVNDRGPMSQKYVVDLSYQAAQAIGISGFADVRIDELRKDDPEVLLAMNAGLPRLSAPLIEDTGANAEGMPVLDPRIALR